MTHFGIHSGPQECSIQDLYELWDLGEALGFDWISIWDHFYAAQVPPDRDCFEGIACHSALAVRTSKVRVGSLVYCTGYRHPAVLANAGATIDHLSGGRLEMGLGAGWHDGEYKAYGLPFESPATRLRRLAESVEVIKLLWTEEVSNFHGEFYDLEEARCHPKPLQSPPRIWIGATGEKLALPMVGRLADAWNTPYVSPEDFARKRAIVLEHAPAPERFVTGVNLGLVFAESDVDEELRRRFGATAPYIKPGTLCGSVAEIVDRIGQYQAVGADWINLGLRAPFDLAAIERFATEVLPQVS